MLSTEDEVISIQEDVLRNSILLYDSEKIEDFKTFKANVSNKCQCKVEDLSHIQVLVLHYSTPSHEPASSFLKINGIVMASEDEVILPPADTINPQQNIKAFGGTAKVRIGCQIIMSFPPHLGFIDN